MIKLGPQVLEEWQHQPRVVVPLRKEPGQARHNRQCDQQLQRDLAPGGEAEVLATPDFQIVVEKTDAAETEQAKQRDPNVGITQVGPQQGRDEN